MTEDELLKQNKQAMAKYMNFKSTKGVTPVDRVVITRGYFPKDLTIEQLFKDAGFFELHELKLAAGSAKIPTKEEFEQAFPEEECVKRKLEITVRYTDI
jgi:hypothetical protein